MCPPHKDDTSSLCEHTPPIAPCAFGFAKFWFGFTQSQFRFAISILCLQQLFILVVYNKPHLSSWVAPVCACEVNPCLGKRSRRGHGRGAPRSPLPENAPTLGALGGHLPYTRVGVANEHRAESRGAAPEENYEFMQFSP